ncbi:MAG TPA: lysylphosphatidylglycerol synthase domain-containing protein [Stellaceae bacterium]|nr:lysylphosphatidylglycerol synthase domain-containing protein [Stellaceae bacterium]
MRAGVTILAVLGVMTGALLVTWHGVAAVGAALQLAGWSGLAAISLFHFAPLALCALAWRMLMRRPRAGAIDFVWFRWLRDTGGEMLGMVPAVGEVISIRAMVGRGTELSLAAASTVVDLTVEICAQLVFTLLGLGILLVQRPVDWLVRCASVGALVLAALVLGFALAQRLGLFHALERITLRLAATQGWSALGALAGLHQHIRGIYDDRGAVGRAMALHCLAWIVGIGEAGIALALMGVPVGIATLIVLESLTYALRSAAFFVPAAAGVQEGGYVLLGAALGIGPEFALALSLLKRGRELVLGLAALALWQWLEGRSLWRRRPLARRRKSIQRADR